MPEGLSGLQGSVKIGLGPSQVVGFYKHQLWPQRLEGEVVTDTGFSLRCWVLLALEWLLQRGNNRQFNVSALLHISDFPTTRQTNQCEQAVIH